MLLYVRKKLRNLIKSFIIRNYNLRKTEYEWSKKYVPINARVLDVACGNGTFLEFHRENRNVVGIDSNPDNVAYCQSLGLRVQFGDALRLDFENACFDVVHISHLLHAMTPKEVAVCLRECCRVLREGGVMLISTHNVHSDFFVHPENVRPYPPVAIYSFFSELSRSGAGSPMFSGLPKMAKISIWLRRPPLIKFKHSHNEKMLAICIALNALQYGCSLKRFWRYDSYILALRKL
jgi:SAM-dependent methyltransferase